MRIQDTDRILKEARINRAHTAREMADDSGIFSRAWRMVSQKVTGLFRRD